MINILLVGNGFDLAHGLNTSYFSFWYALKNWQDIFDIYCKIKEGEEYIEGGHFDYLLKDCDKLEKSKIVELDRIIKNNSWINYYINCGAEIDGWIDFEKEIYPVIELFESVFNAHYIIKPHNAFYGKAIISNEQITQKALRIVPLWNEYFRKEGDNAICVSEAFVAIRYGILKKKMLQRLRTEFDEFVYAFELYLHEFVCKAGTIKLLKQVKEIGMKYVISFNYTLTECLYGIEESHVHHIHGKIRDDLAVEDESNIVMGINNANGQSMDFIYFVKYFQRIQKHSGVKYKEFINAPLYVDDCNRTVKDKFNLHIYGHSLDETDEDILRFVIGEKGITGGLDMKPEKVVIYFYDAPDYEQKVINLINLFGRDIVEEYIEKGLFEFIKTSNVFLE